MIHIFENLGHIKIGATNELFCFLKKELSVKVFGSKRKIMKVPVIPPVARDLDFSARQIELPISESKITGFVVYCLGVVASESALFPQVYAFHVTRPFFRNAFRSMRKKKARV